MELKKYQENKLVKFASNIFVVIFLVFLIWMVFFDENSYLTHRKFNKEINDLEKTISFYQTKIEQDKATIKKLEDSLLLQQFAREKYLMKKENEDIYIIELETLKNHE